MIITVTQLNKYLKAAFETDEILQNITVKGELTNLKTAQGCIYFTLKDENSHIDCFSYLIDRGQFKTGGEVEATGSIRYLEKSGKISFFVKSIEVGKQGTQYLKFLELREKLKAEGIFDDAHKKPLPKIPRTIGVVTSKDGAVIKDIFDVVRRRQPFTNILLYSVRVQGEFAEADIVSAIEYFSHSDIDVLIVARGGGSSEDLSAFNSEKVVRAIYACKIPTVSAVGHGVDFTLCDYVADLRAVTPTEAAELATIDAPQLCQGIKNTIFNCQKSIFDKFGIAKQKIRYTIKDIASFILHQIDSKQNRTLRVCKGMLNTVCQKHYALQRDSLGLLERVNLCNPTNILKKGFAAVYADESRIKTVDQLQIGQTLKLNFFDGKVEASVDKIQKDEK